MGWKDWSYAPWHWRAIRVLDSDEATGFVMTGICRAVFATWIGVYGVLALTGLGEELQDCQTKKVNFGGVEIFTSSIISAVLAVEGVFNAVMTPLFGAIADGSSKRTQLFRIVLSMLASCIIVLGVLLFFPEETYSLVLFGIFSILGALLFELQTVLHAAYLPEVSPEEDVRLKVTARYHSIGSLMQLIFIGLALAANTAFGLVNDKIASPQVAAAVAFVIWSFWAIPGMALLDSRPKTPEQKRVSGLCGFRGIWLNIRECYTKYTHMGRFLYAYAFYISGCNALIGLATSYLLTELGIKGFDVQVLIGLALVFTIPGALLSGYLCKRFGSLHRLVVAVCCLWVVIICSIPLLLVGEVDPDPVKEEVAACALEEGSNVVAKRPAGFSSIAVYIEAVLWGFGLGLVYPVNWAIMAEMVPGGAEAGFFGLKTFAGKVLSWSPPLLFTVINESTDNARLAVSSMLPFVVIGLIILLTVDLEKAKEQVAETLHLRHGYVEDIEQTVVLPEEPLVGASNKVAPAKETFL